MSGNEGKIVLLSLIFILNIIGYFVVTTSMPFDNDSLDLSYYNTLMIVKSGFILSGLLIIYKLISACLDRNENYNKKK